LIKRIPKVTIKTQAPLKPQGIIVLEERITTILKSFENFELSFTEVLFSASVTTATEITAGNGELL